MNYSLDNIHKELSVEAILKEVPESVLWRYYLGFDFAINKTFNAPYRKDNNASFGLYYDLRGRLMFKDFATRAYGDVFNYIQMLYGCGFIESLRRVNADFNLCLGRCEDQYRGVRINKKDLETLSKFAGTFAKRNPIQFECKVRKYNPEDISYWMQYGITPNILRKYHVYCVDKLLQNKYLIYTHTEKDPAYAYHFPVSKHFKFYFPKRSVNRFRGNTNNLEDIQGYYQCRVKENYSQKILVLTKSMKDCMLLHRYGIDAMSIHGEGHFFSSDFIRHIKKYYPRIVSLYDADRAGIIGARVLWKEYKIEPHFIPREFRSEICKDVSDIFKECGEEELRRMLEEEFGIVTLEF